MNPLPLIPESKTVKLSEIAFDERIYPRQKHDPALVQRYAESLESIEARGNFIGLTGDGRLLDGRHRHLAYLTVSQADREIPVYVYPITDNDQAFDLAVELNSSAGWQMTEADKRHAALKMYTRADRKSQEEIAKILGTSNKRVNTWLSEILHQEREEREEKIYGLWMACSTQEVIAGQVGMNQSDVASILRKISESYYGKDSDIFRNFAPQIYQIWSFGKSTNSIHHPGNIPPEIIDNLLYYYTKPFEVVFDPFGGGGSTIDKCLERRRRYYVSDLRPIPARPDIRQWNIVQGLPPDLPIPDLIFLDPPYWKQAEGKYSDSEDDLSNMSLNEFLGAIGNFVRDIKRKWNGNRPEAKLALIIGPYMQSWKYTDLAFLCYQAITKYLQPIIRVQVPYSTQVHGGDYVNKAKEQKKILYLARDLMIFGP